MAITLDRTAFNALVDDDGSGTTGTPWNKTQIANVILNPTDAALAQIPAAGNNNSASVTDTNAAYSIPNATWQVVRYNTADYDPQVVVTGNTTFNAPVAGWYTLTATVKWDTDTTSNRSIRFLVNGATAYGVTSLPAMASMWQTTAAIVHLGAGHTVIVQVFQSTGAARTLVQDPGSAPRFGIGFLRAG